MVVGVNIVPGYPGIEPHHPNNSCSRDAEDVFIYV